MLDYNPLYGANFGPMSPAMEITYENIRPNILYRGKKYIPLPKGEERHGHGTALFMLCPSQEDTIKEIQKGYLRWYLDSYRWYTTDTMFNAKIGRKRIMVNMNQVIRRDWNKTRFSHPLRYVPPKQRHSMLRENPNVIVDLGEWTKFYFEYSYKVSVPVIIKNYIKFLVNQINSSDWSGYQNKILYVPINQWFTDQRQPLGFTRKLLTNPLAILMFAAYKYPDVIATLPEMTFIFGDSTSDQFMMYHTSDLNKANFNKMKMRLKQMSGFKWDDKSESLLEANFTPEEEDDDSDVNNPGNLTEYEDPRKLIPTPTETTTPEEQAKVNLMKENRARLINDMKRGLLGDANSGKVEPKKPSDDQTPGAQKTENPAPDHNKISESSSAKKPSVSVPTPQPVSTVGQPVQSVLGKAPIDDITTDDEVYDDEDIDDEENDTTPISVGDDDIDQAVIDAVDDEIEKMIEEDPDALLNVDGSLTAKRVAPAVNKAVRATYMPTKSKEVEERIYSLKQKAEGVMPTLPTAKQIESRKITPKDISKVIKTTNPNLGVSKFANFDKDYNEKKLPEHIDSAVRALANAEVGIYVVGKDEEDTSDQLNLKKTITYHLQDENGGKHTIKLDIPIIIDDHYIYVNGSRKLMQHQLFLMPLMKLKPNEVQIVTWYKKLTLERKGINDTRTSALKKYLSSDPSFNVTPGNAMRKNHDLKYRSTLDIDMFAKQIVSFDVGDNHFILDREALDKKFNQLSPKMRESVDLENEIPVGYNSITRKPLIVTSSQSLTELVLSLLDDKSKKTVIKNTKKSITRLLRTEIEIMSRPVPLIVLLCFWEGFTTVMKKADINYFTIDKNDDTANLASIDRHTYEIFECADKYIVWERNPIWNTMLMNGFANIDLTQFDLADLDSRDIMANILTNYFTSKGYSFALMQFYDFMIDAATKEVLEDHDLPTDLVSLILVGNRMLADNEFTPMNSADAVRVRSNEIIAQTVYEVIAKAYQDFRATQTRMGRGKRPTPLNVKPDAVITSIVKDSPLTNDASVLNPILELEKARMVTPKGPRGVGKDRALTLQRRAYDPSMLGITGVTTSPDAKVGVNRQLTLEPNITSTLGYVKPTDKDKIDDLTSVNLLTPAELLSPPGVLHDDGPRTAMSYKQSQYMLPVVGSKPVFFGNSVEKVVPYHMSRQFVIVAKDDGKVVEKKDDMVIVQYKDGTYDSFDTSPKMKKNSSSGFYIRSQMTTKLNVGDTFIKNEILATDPQAFTKDSNDKSASMNIGVPIKVAIIPNYDIYEDAAPITENLSEKFTTVMAMKSTVGIPAQSYVEKMVNIGDRVEVDDPLIIYDPAHEDSETNAFLNEIRTKLGDDISSLIDIASMPQVRAEYTGIISEIEVYTSVPVEELSPSLQKIVNKYHAKAKRNIKLLEKYQNPGDMKYYKCGQIITNSPEVVKPDYGHKVNNIRIGDDGRGVAIVFFIEFKDIAKTGDKGSAFTALKFTTSHVIPKGREAYSEYRPNEEISTFIAPGAILARKTPSIWLTMATNKCLIEMTRHAIDIFFNDAEK